MNWKSLAATVSILLFCVAVPKISSAQQRALLFTSNPSEPLQKVVSLLRDTTTPVTDAKQLTWSPRYFVRIANRSLILNSAKQLNDSELPNQNDARLGGCPFVFFTSPESIYGHSLLDIYQSIGYEAEDILRYQLNQDMVAIVFRYPDDVVPTPEITDGHLPLDWRNRVYAPHWDNVFPLFHNLVQESTVDPDKTGTFAPSHLFFQSDEEKAFALKASESTNANLKNRSYTWLKAYGGDDWRYRELLESKLSLFEHFHGNGHAWNEVIDPKGEQTGILEFVGPNRKLKELPELAIIDLGHITITTTYQEAETTPTAK